MFHINAHPRASVVDETLNNREDKMTQPVDIRRPLPQILWCLVNRPIYKVAMVTGKERVIGSTT